MHPSVYPLQNNNPPLTFTILSSGAVETVAQFHVALSVTVSTSGASERDARPIRAVVPCGTDMLVRLKAGVIAVVASRAVTGRYSQPWCLTVHSSGTVKRFRRPTRTVVTWSTQSTSAVDIVWTDALKLGMAGVVGILIAA